MLEEAEAPCLRNRRAWAATEGIKIGWACAETVHESGQRGASRAVQLRREGGNLENDCAGRVLRMGNVMG